MLFAAVEVFLAGHILQQGCFWEDITSFCHILVFGSVGVTGVGPMDVVLKIVEGDFGGNLIPDTLFSHKNVSIFFQKFWMLLN